MRPILVTAAALVVFTALFAGCTVQNTQQSTAPNDSGSERTFTIDVPANATAIRVDTTADARGGTPDVTVLVKDEAGNILGTHTWAVKDRASDSLSVNVSGQARLIVVAKVVDGDASLDVQVYAVVPNQPEVIVERQTIVIVQQQTATTTTPASPSAPATATPSSTPTPVSSTAAPSPTPTPSPTPPVNSSNNTTSTNTTTP